MSRADELLGEITKMDSEGSQIEQQRAEWQTRRRANVEELRREILNGSGTGDPLFDAVIVNHGIVDRRSVEILHTIQREVAEHRNELVMLVERDIHRFVFRDPGPSRSDDFMTTERIIIGRLNGPHLVVRTRATNLAKDPPDKMNLPWDPEHRLIGFPTSGYIIDPPYDPNPAIIAGDLFPELDLLMAYRQPLHTWLDDVWSGGSFGFGSIPMFPRTGPGGNKLDVYIGDGAVDQQVGGRSITRPLHLWWIRRALGQDVAPTPEIERALAELASDRLQKFELRLDELAERKRKAGLEALEREIHQSLSQLERLGIDLPLKLRQKMGELQISPP